DYKRKQTLKNAERYITDELKRYEEQVTTAKERSDKLEHELFLDLRLAAVAAVAELCSVARAVARLDVLASLAWIARERGYVCPRMEEGSRLLIEEGRHPVLEQTLRDQTFVPNDVCLGAESLDALDQGAVDPTGDLTGPPDPHEVADGSDAGFASEDGGPAAPGGATIAIVTGPNMAGKSTFCRQTALIALMAQVGSFVPARRATLGVCDRIFARIGSADEIQSGLSTFMVEMTETANILNHATDKSLVVLDEVGRGTSTFDGVSLAFAITEHLAREIGARTLFATHYHELTELPEREARAKNLCVDVKEWGEEIIFLHKIVEGSTDKSYGLHVARLAGVPQGVIDRAQDVLQDLERLTLDAKGEPRVRGPQRAAAQGVPAARGPQQLDLFAPPADQLKTALMRLDLANLTPIKALLWLSEWQEKVRG
ncbi:MAG: MutS-related protein, partial [Planctomycetota bacterium]